MTIFIETREAGRGRTLVHSFDDKHDLLCYADEVLACHDNFSMIKGYWTTIDTICEALCDMGMGTGSRTHRRITREEAREKFRDGSAANYCHSWHLSEGAGTRQHYRPKPAPEPYVPITAEQFEQALARTRLIKDNKTLERIRDN